MNSQIEGESVQSYGLFQLNEQSRRDNMKKLLATVLSAVMLVASLPVAAATGYQDTTGHWAEQQIDAFSELGILKGYNGSFRPNDSITRGEMAVILDRIMDYQESAENSFTDLDENFYTDAILKANASGIMLGDGDTVRPNDAITRQEATVLLSRALGIEGNGDLTQFSDSGNISPWARKAIGAMADRGYIQGYGDEFLPLNHITRAEVVTILNRSIQKLVSAGETVTGDVDGDVVVRGGSVKLSDMTISGNLILAEGVADGEVYLDNVTIEGNTIVRGGGTNSIYMNNVRANGGIVVRKLDGKVRIVTSGSTVVTVAVMESGAILVGDGFQTVEIPADMMAEQTIEIQGKVEVLQNHSEDVTIKVDGTIGTLETSVATTIVGENVVINKVVAEEGSVIVNDTEVKPGNSYGAADQPTNNSKDNVPSGGSSGGSGSFGGGSSSGGNSSGGNSSGGSSSSGGSNPPSSDSDDKDDKNDSDESDDNSNKIEVVKAETAFGDNEYGIKLDAKSVKLGTGQTYELTAYTKLPAGSDTSISWSSNDTAIATVSNGIVTGVAAGSTTVKAQVANLYDENNPYTIDCDITVKNLDWVINGDSDSRLANGYPLCSTTKDGKIVIKLKASNASSSDPLEVFMVVNQMNSYFDTDVTSVLHGHVGKDTIIWPDAIPYVKLENTEEITINTDVIIDGENDVKILFVLKNSDGTSTEPIEVKFTGEITKEVDAVAPKICSAYINAARDTIYLHSGLLDHNSVPDASAFTLTTGQVTAVSILNEDTRSTSCIKLSVSGITDADLSGLCIAYTAPTNNPLQDTATTPNQVESFDQLKVETATISITEAHVSADGKYIYLKTENCQYNNGDFIVTATTNSGSTISYNIQSFGHSFGGSHGEFSLLADDAALSAGETITIQLTPSSGMIDYAMDAVTQPITTTATTADTALAMKTATYDSTKKVLTIEFDGDLSDDWVYGCNFTLIAPDGTEYVIRGANIWESSNDHGNHRNFDFSEMYVEPQSGWKLKYQVQHKNDSYEIVTGLSGEPMPEQTIDITMS